MGWLKSLGAAGLLLASSSCATNYKIRSRADLENRINTSQELVQQRKAEAESLSPREKADYFEGRILNELITLPYYLIPEALEKGKPKLGNIESTTHFLAALAYKYGVTKDRETEILASKMISSIIEMDSANSLDGYLPFRVEVKDSNIKIIKNDTHSNVYMQLLFSYANAKRLFNSNEINEKLSFHSTLIASHFIRNNFILRDDEGHATEPGSLKSTGITSHTDNLGGLSVVENCLYLIDREKNEELAMQLEKQKRFFRKNLDTNDKIQNLSFKLGFIEFPTQSTHWLSFLSLHSDIIASNKNGYRRAFKKLFGETQKQHNPLFNALYLDAGFKVESKEREVLLNDIEFCLRTYPLTLDDREVLNSFNFDITRRSPRAIKMIWQKEARNPLPVYQRSLNGFNWKVNQLNLDGNIRGIGTRHHKDRITGVGNTTYPGNDYLLLYWMNEYIKSKN